MLQLQAVEFNQIQQWFVDFQKKSKCLELPPEDSYFLGIYLDDLLIGYFVLRDVEAGVVEINQGYLKKVARHVNVSYESMDILQRHLKLCGIKQIVLKASRSLRAYTKFMGNLGFKPESIIYSKRI